ncbi:hypothetical protein GUJ93_ZPchr0006g41420 [Zizania palustris]|uniref:Uncharacterized protein n=1 Tax=Zizania palustris TaxID=103762 RepID=A0A8J5W1B3_ZIZPA|nr:hypothetical protein GUJ93_ZPchr0006g41420 [Zizania palustris]
MLLPPVLHRGFGGTRDQSLGLECELVHGQATFISLAQLLEHPCSIEQKRAGADDDAPSRKRKSKEACSPSGKKVMKREATSPNRHVTQSATHLEAKRRQAEGPLKIPLPPSADTDDSRGCLRWLRM